MSRIVLFGAGGFIGSHVLARLADHVVITPSRREVDLGRPSEIRRTLRRGDVVINAAGYAAATDRTRRGIERMRADNVEAVSHLAEVGAEVGVARLIHLSSVAAMGRGTGSDRDEEFRGPITSPYAATKAEAEQILNQHRNRMAITILRPTSVFGEGRSLAATLCRLAALRVVPLPGGGRAMIPFTSVENVAHAVRLVATTSEALNDTYIVGDAQSYPLRDIVCELGERIGARPMILPLPVWAVRRTIQLHRLVFKPVVPLVDEWRLETMTTSVSYSIDKFRVATGYAPVVLMTDALRRLAAWHLSDLTRVSR